MYFTRKLRRPQMSIETIIGIAMLPVMALLFIFWGFRAAFLFIALVELVAVVIQVNLYVRTRNVYFLWMAVSFAFLFIFALVLGVKGLEQARENFALLAAGVVLAAASVLYIVGRRKIKWRNREILEMAAMPVSEAGDGYTERPMPSGTLEITQLDLESFTAFVRENLIAVPYTDGETVVYSLPGTYLKQIGFGRGYENDTWVSIGLDGQVSASISRVDYLKYKDRFSFDQLCKSLGNLFREFFEMYRRGEERNILKLCDDLRLNPFIE